jgi:hypothetical protein
MIDNWELPQTCKTINLKLDKKNVFLANMPFTTIIIAKPERDHYFLSYFIQYGI